jgi:hypothetical protein
VWNYVIAHFDRFLQDIELRPEERQDADGKAERIARSLAAKYYPNQPFNPAWFIKVGSFGKGLACRPRSDLDMLFILPDADCGRIQQLQGNRQSQLLQEVKTQVSWTFPATNLRADGQVVIAPFNTYQVDIVPAFALGDGTYLTAHTGEGGSWNVTAPHAEARDIQAADQVSAGKSTHLNKMVKVWKRECNVEMKSVFLEIIVNKFVEQWQFRDQTLYYYDWMMRDFFAYLLKQVNNNAKLAGTTEWKPLGNQWETKALSAYSRAIKACEYEKLDYQLLATDEWRKIFGYQFKGSRITALEAVMAAMA